MAGDILHLLGVTLGLVCVYIVPFLSIGRFLLPGGSAPAIVMTALVISTSMQAVLGMLWSHIVGAFPRGEIAVFVLAWLTLLLWSRKASRHHGTCGAAQTPAPHQTAWGGSSAGTRRNPCARPWFEKLVPPVRPIRHGGGMSCTPLLLILAAAFLVRAIHPLQVAYLGQSDAYTHLHYIHNILNAGKLINPVYPPGYHWIHALPAMLFSIDPYHVARFGGAFFGLGLVLGLYTMLDQIFGPRAAIFGSFCAACFPVTLLLQKTGVGVFANQFGIMLLPMIFFLYWRIVSKPGLSWREGLLFGSVMSGLVVSVPMMVLHVIIILALDRLITLCRGEARWLAHTTALAVLIIPAVALLSVHLGRAGQEARGVTARILVEDSSAPIAEATQDAGDTPVTSSKRNQPLASLVANFTKVKRPHGLGRPIYNAAALALIATFLSCGLIGIRRNNKALQMIGLWGAVTTIQTMFGMLQFSAYQREGWSMLVAVSALAGILGSYFYEIAVSFHGTRVVVACIMVLSFAWMVARPPAHPALKLVEEDMLIRTIRAVGASEARREQIIDRGRPPASLLRKLNPDVPLGLVTRRFSSWQIQDEIAANVLPPGSALKVYVASPGRRTIVLEDNREYVVLIDRARPGKEQRGTGATSILTPTLADSHSRQLQRLHEVNIWLEQWVEQLAAAGRERTVFDLAPGLTGHVLSAQPQGRSEPDSSLFH